MKAKHHALLSPSDPSVNESKRTIKLQPLPFVFGFFLAACSHDFFVPAPHHVESSNSGFRTSMPLAAASAERITVPALAVER